MFEDLLGEGETFGALSGYLDTPFIDYYYLVPNRPNEGCLLTNPSFVPNTCPFELVGIREKPSPFIEDDQSDEWRVEEVPAYLASIVQKLCGIFPNTYVHVLLKGGPFAVEERDHMFLLASSGFDNPNFMVSPFKFSFQLFSFFKTSRLWVDLKIWSWDWKGQSGFLNAMRPSATSF